MASCYSSHSKKFLIDWLKHLCLITLLHGTKHTYIVLPATLAKPVAPVFRSEQIFSVGGYLRDGNRQNHSLDLIFSSSADSLLVGKLLNPSIHLNSYHTILFYLDWVQRSDPVLCVSENQTRQWVWPTLFWLVLATANWIASQRMQKDETKSDVMSDMNAPLF